MPDSYSPPAGVRSAARRALAIREKQPPSNRAMTAVGLKRAADLSGGRSVGLATIKRMWAFFNRHSANYAKINEKTSKWYQAWLGWGGNAGLRWVYGILRERDEIRDVAPTVARILGVSPDGGR